MKVDLPAPLRPTNPTRSPADKASEARSNSARSLMFKTRSWAEMSTPSFTMREGSYRGSDPGATDRFGFPYRVHPGTPPRHWSG